MYAVWTSLKVYAKQSSIESMITPMRG